jgi:hypothetical protein
MRAALLGSGSVIVLLIAAQVALPKIAARRISSRVGRYGEVKSVSVSAWPAVKLLWDEVDAVKVRAGRLALSTSEAAKLLWEAHGVRTMELSAASVKLGPLRVEEAVLSKHGASMSAHARTSESDVAAALPQGLEVKLLGSREGQVEVQASGGLFGVDASLDALAGASEGKLVARPLAPLLEGFELTLFADPHVFVEGVGASVVGRQPLSYELSMSASLR